MSDLFDDHIVAPPSPPSKGTPHSWSLREATETTERGMFCTNCGKQQNHVGEACAGK